MRIIQLLAIILVSCSTASSQQEIINKRVDLVEFKSILKDKSEIQLVDIRTQQEFDQGYIPNAVNIDFYSQDFINSCTNQLDKSKPVAIYCAGGGRSAKALKQLKDAGFSEVYELGVGYNGYK